MRAYSTCGVIYFVFPRRFWVIRGFLGRTSQGCPWEIRSHLRREDGCVCKRVMICGGVEQVRSRKSLPVFHACGMWKVCSPALRGMCSSDSVSL